MPGMGIVRSVPIALYSCTVRAFGKKGTAPLQFEGDPFPNALRDMRSFREELSWFDEDDCFLWWP